MSETVKTGYKTRIKQRARRHKTEDPLRAQNTKGPTRGTEDNH